MGGIKMEERTVAELKEMVRLHGGEYSETFLINSNGRLDKKRRLDGNFPYLIAIGGIVETEEDLYNLMYKISIKHPQFQISFEVDENKKWIKYIIREEEKTK